jgi:RNA polymerase sigma factor (sigma-70 family)
VAQDERREVDDAGKRAPSPEAARQERLAQLVLCRTKLSASEALLLNEVFPTIVASHYDRVWNWLRKRGLPSHEAEDLLQEAFLDLHGYILEHGFPDNLPGLLRKITMQKFLDYLRARRRAPVSVALPSSGSEKPRSDGNVERLLARRELTHRLLEQLSPEHRSVIETVLLNGLTHGDAAAVLGLPEGTVKSRLLAARRELWALVERMLPPSQRDAL